MPAVLAVAAHPDDIEFRMAGTLLLLGDAGWDLHYCNLSRGNLGSETIPGPALARMRRVGVSVLDVSPRVLSAAVVNRYLAIKARASL